MIKYSKYLQSFSTICRNILQIGDPLPVFTLEHICLYELLFLDPIMLLTRCQLIGCKMFLMNRIMNKRWLHKICQFD